LRCRDAADARHKGASATVTASEAGTAGVRCGRTRKNSGTPEEEA
jgi:hypothetical protein